MFEVLFLCTGNSCRSILSEAFLNHIGHGRLKAYSAGSAPKKEVNAYALKILMREGISTSGLYSKSLNEFTHKHFDLVVTVCDDAKGESCPLFMGEAPIQLHWGVPDPALSTGTDEEILAEFERIFTILKRPIKELAEMPAAKLHDLNNLKKLQVSYDD